MSEALSGALIGLGGVILGVALTVGWEWWRSNRSEKQEQDSLRQLVAQEIDLNYCRLLAFVGTMMQVKKRHTFSGIAPVVEEVLGRPPMWVRTRWDSAPVLIARAFKQDDILRIGRWYVNLDGIGRAFGRVAQQSILLGDAKSAHTPTIIPAEYVEKQLEEILKAAVKVLYERRPYVHQGVEAVRKAHDDAVASGNTDSHLVDEVPPPIFRFNGAKWEPISAETLLSAAAMPSDSPPQEEG